MFSIINAYLQKGYKMTTSSCQKCNQTIFMSPDNKFSCLSCNLQFNQIQTQFKAKSRNDASKLMGEKLLQGWAMLAQCCEECNIPLMKDRKGQVVCLSCQKDFSKNKNKVQTNQQNAELKQQIQQKKQKKTIKNQQFKPQSFSNKQTHNHSHTNTKQIIQQTIQIAAQQIKSSIQKSTIEHLQHRLTILQKIISLHNQFNQ